MDIIEITPEAKHKLLALKQGQNSALDPYLRIGSRGGGCGVAVSYFLGFDHEQADDQIFTVSGIELVINKGQLLQLQGLKVDWLETQSEQGFKFTASANPAIATN